MNQQKTRNLAFMSLFIAIEILMVMVPFLGFIPIGPLRATTLHIPVIIAGIVLGKKQGSASWSRIWLIQPHYQHHPTNDHIVCLSHHLSVAHYGVLVIAIMPRVCIGYVAGLIYEKWKKPSHTSHESRFSGGCNDQYNPCFRRNISFFWQSICYSYRIVVNKASSLSTDNYRNNGIIGSGCWNNHCSYCFSYTHSI